MRVPFVDLYAQYKEIEKDVRSSYRRILRKSDFILGKEERLFEQEFAGYCGRKFAIGVNSGTDALILSLLSLGVGPGDEVIVPAFTFIATASSVSLTGARPVFVDIDEKTLNIDVDSIGRAITRRTKAIMPVHLFGQPSDMTPLLKIARKYKLKVIEDAAQAQGAMCFIDKAHCSVHSRLRGRTCLSALKGALGNPICHGADTARSSRFTVHSENWKKTGAMGDLGCFSFYPTKNLGAFGDAGMIVLDDARLYKKLLMLRDNGRKSKYEHSIIGYNSRLDTLQAAVLSCKLKHLDAWNDLRRKNAEAYSDLLKGVPGVVTPYEAAYARHVYHMYVIRVKNRDRIAESLRKEGIGVLVHYPIPLHLQEAYKPLGYKKGDFPVAERVSKEVLSLPMSPFLRAAQIKYVVSRIKKIIGIP